MNRCMIFLVLALGVSFATADEPPADQRWDAKRFKDVEQWAQWLEHPERDAWQQPLEVLDFLALRPGDQVADIGAGTGYFTRFLSFPVGELGQVYAVDTEEAMVERIDQMEHSGRKRVTPILAAPGDPGLPQDEIDLVLVANTWPLIKKRPAYLEKLREAMTPGGRLAIIGFRKDERVPVGPPLRRRLAREEVIEELEAEDWRFVAESVMLQYQYFLIFRPPADPDPQPIGVPDSATADPSPTETQPDS